MALTYYIGKNSVEQKAIEAQLANQYCDIIVTDYNTEGWENVYRDCFEWAVNNPIKVAEELFQNNSIKDKILTNEELVE